MTPGGTPIDIRYRITGYEGAVGPGHPLWQAPLPTIPGPPAETTPAPGAQPASITHADYFQALRSYVSGPGRDHIQRALSAHRFGQLRPSRITIALEKHGEFYHPARLVVASEKEAVSLALNVAVTATGRTWMASEVAALSRVAGRLPSGCLPTVYGQAAVPLPDRTPLTLFLADWFDGFYEFHLSVDPRSGAQGMVVWDTRGGPFFLAEQQQADVYRQCAYLLARSYDPASTAQIYPWHHAAGDFILGTAGGSLAVRLITARQYAPTLAGVQDRLDDEARLTALLAFFLNLTLRNRLDRLDGTGPVAWAGPHALPATVAGVFQALDAESAGTLTGLLAAFGTAELIDTLEAVAERYGLMPMEEALVHANLAPHAELLLETFARMRRDA